MSSALPYRVGWATTMASTQPAGTGRAPAGLTSLRPVNQVWRQAKYWGQGSGAPGPPAGNIGAERGIPNYSK
jgi:hypothetical protein